MELEQALIDLIDSRIDERLQSLEDKTPIQWYLKDLCDYVGRSKNWVTDHITVPNRDELDVKNGGFVHYPENHGDPMVMTARAMKQWLNDNPEKVI